MTSSSWWNSVIVAVLITTAAHSQAEEYRTWTDSSGQFRTEAQFQSFKEGKVELKKKSGAVVKIPLERLGAEDQKYVREHALSEAPAESNGPTKRPPSSPAAISWEKAFGIKVIITIKKGSRENVEVAKLPKSEGLDFDKMFQKSQLAIAKGIGESSVVKNERDEGLIVTLRLGRDDSTGWPKDEKSCDGMHLWGQVLVGTSLLKYNLLLTETRAKDGLVLGKASGSIAEGSHFQNAEFEMRPIKDELDRD